MVMVWDQRQTKYLHGLVHSWMKWDRVHCPLSWWGEASPNFDRRTGVQRWGQKTACEAWLWVLNGTGWRRQRWQRPCSGVRDFLWPHNGLALTPCLCFALRLSDGLSHPCDLSHLPLALCSYVPSWSLCHGDHLQGQSELCWLSLFGFLTFPFAISVTVLVARLVAISVSALSGPWFLFFFWAAHGMPVPHDAAVHCVGVMVRVTIREDGFLILICCQELPNTMHIKIGRWRTQHGRHNLTPTGEYKQREE